MPFTSIYVLLHIAQDKLLRLWCHEESRVFRDRLISAEDRTWFNDALQVSGTFCWRISSNGQPEMMPFMTMKD